MAVRLDGVTTTADTGGLLLRKVESIAAPRGGLSAGLGSIEPITSNDSATLIFSRAPKEVARVSHHVPRGLLEPFYQVDDERYDGDRLLALQPCLPTWPRRALRGERCSHAAGLPN